MKTTNDMYDLCRYFINDHESELRDAGLYERLLGKVRSRDLAALCSSSVLFDCALHSIDVLRLLKQVEALFKKNKAFSNPGTCSTAARKAFFKAEQMCRITNRRLDWYYVQRDRLDPDLNLYLLRAERYIKRVLGCHRTFLNEIPNLIRITSGATSTNSRSKSLPQLKLTMRPTCTDGAVPYLDSLYRFYGYKEPKFRITNENRVTLVPKNWKTDRTIACEPDGNLPLQLAFDGWAKKRLRFHGIDLSDQTRNQVLSREGSIDGRLATVDFSMASDTISYNAVAWLLPHDWFLYLARLRSSHFKGEFGTGKYAKFSSMGNGATFAVETLIFASLAYAVGSKEFSVYGDDVIIESELFGEYVRLAKFMGFVVNEDKSYSTGFFRESCGTDWYKGELVTPRYIRHLDSRKSFMSHNVNLLVEVSKPFGSVWKYLRNFIEENSLQLVPKTHNTLEGVHITPFHAYEHKLIRTRNYIQRYKAYRYRDSHRKFGDIRGLTLWYLQSCNLLSERSFHFDPGMELVKRERITSRAPFLSGKYRKEWVSWLPPAQVIPPHLYWWGDYVIRT